MTLHGRILVAALLFGAAAPMAAQQPQQRITFDDAIGLALKNNVSVRQAQNTVDLNDAAVKQQKLQRLPDLRLNVSGAENVGRSFDQNAGSVVDQQSQALSSGLSSSMTLFDGGKTQAAIRGAQATSQASASDLSRARQTAVFTVAQDYVALSNQQAQLGVQQDNLAAQQGQLDLIQKFVDAGSRPTADLYQQQAVVASARLSIAQVNRAVEEAKINLIQALQLDPAGTYDFVAPKLTPAANQPTYSLDSLITRAYAARADLEAQQSRSDAAAQDVKVAKAARLPTISVTGGYNSAFNTASQLGLADQLNQRRGGSVGIGMSIPLFDRGAANVAAQRAQIAEDNARLALDSQKQAVALDVRRAYLDQTSAKEQLAAAEAQLAAAAQAVNMAQQRYQAGAATLVDVTQARAQQTAAASAVATARNNLVLQQTVLSYYTGDLDPNKVSLE